HKPATASARPKATMLFDEETTGLQAQLREAIDHCAIRRLSGPPEKYMEAFDLVEALQLQLKRRLSQHLPGPA
ncbi:MAG: hypothetical protein ABIT82_06625, partial [Ramlibacter sp.]